MALRLRIVTPERVLADAEVSEISAPGTVGEFGVLPEHTAYIGMLDAGLVSYHGPEANGSVAVYGGYGEVSGDVVTILADDAELPEEIDKDEATSELAEAVRLLEAGSDDPAEMDRLLVAHRRAETRSALAS
ncbi:MAG: ATP synthase F1 subunit epsilon [Deltaproteobacteria bacterium]